MMMTVFSDVSVCKRSCSVGFASWAKVEVWETGKFHQGSFFSTGRETDLLELEGITRAIETCANYGDWIVVTSVMVQCDNLSALSFLKLLGAQDKLSGNGIDRAVPPRKGIGPSPDARRLLDRIRPHVQGKKLFVRHIKGHKRTHERRSDLHNTIDKMARSQMQAMRERQSFDYYEKQRLAGAKEQGDVR